MLILQPIWLKNQLPARDPTWFLDTTMTRIRVNRLNGEVLEVVLTEKEANHLACNRDLKQCLAKADASSWALNFSSQRQHTHKEVVFFLWFLSSKHLGQEL